MGRTIFQIFASAAVVAAVPVLLGPPSTAPARSAPRTVVRPLDFRVDGVEGAAEMRAAGGVWRGLEPGTSVVPPAELRVSEAGILRLVRGRGVLVLDHGARAALFDGTPPRVELERGRARSRAPIGVVGVAAHDLRGAAFGVWVDEAGHADVVALAKTSVFSSAGTPLAELQAGRAAHLGRRGEIGRPERSEVRFEPSGRTAGRIRVSAPGPMRAFILRSGRRRPVQRSAFVRDEDILWVEGPAGRVWKPDGSDGSVEAALRRMASEGGRGSQPGAGLSEPPRSRARPEPSASGRSQPRARPSAAAPGERQRSGPSPSPVSPARGGRGDPDQVPERLEVDWTRPGRPRGRVLEPTKPESSPPTPPSDPAP